MNAIERIERATAFAAEKVKGVTSDDLAKPTPCPDFDVRALLNHVIGNLEMLRSAAAEGKAPLPQGDQFGSDPGAVYAERRAALIAALQGDGVLDGNWEMPFGTLPASMMASIAFMEHLTHGWDIAKATGQDVTMPPVLVTECAATVAPMESMLRTPGVCGPAVAVGADASEQDKLIALMGRQP